MKLPYIAVSGILEHYGFTHKRFSYLKEKFPEVFEAIRKVFEDKEFYNAAHYHTTQIEDLDNRLIAFSKYDHPPVLIENKEYFSERDARFLSLKTGIPFDDFNDAWEQRKL